MSLIGALCDRGVSRNDRQGVFILREQGGHGGIALDVNHATRCIGRPVEEGPAWIDRPHGECDYIAIMIGGLIGTFCDRRVSRNDRQGVLVLREGSRDDGVPMDSYINRTGPAGDSATPAIEGPTWVGCGGQRDYIAIVVWTGVTARHRALADNIDGESVQRRQNGERRGVIGNIVVAKDLQRAERQR